MDLFPLPEIAGRVSTFIATMLFEITLITNQFTPQEWTLASSGHRPVTSFNARMSSADNRQAASVDGPVLSSQKSLQLEQARA
jgi:hypothetical protein